MAPAIWSSIAKKPAPSRRGRAGLLLGAGLLLLVGRLAIGAGGSSAAVTGLPLVKHVAPQAPRHLAVDTTGLLNFDEIVTLSGNGSDKNPQSPVALAAAEQAVATNAAMPISTLPNPKAAPFLIPASETESRQRALDCLTAAIYYEAGSEPDAGQAAVAQVVLNRVRHPHYPKSVCAVVFDRSEGGTCQFTFTCDGALNRTPQSAGWNRARKAAEAALDGKVQTIVGWATHYHTQWVAPIWAPTLLKTAVIGAHIFYRPPNRWDAKAPGNRYVGTEPALAQMSTLLGTPQPAAPALPAPQLAEAAKPQLALQVPST